jgi:hypothetical protein
MFAADMRADDEDDRPFSARIMQTVASHSLKRTDLWDESKQR